MGFWRDIGSSLGVCDDDPQPWNNISYKEPRDNRACYHAKRRGDCPYYREGRCHCDIEAK
jgi:hypothetical protein